MPPLKTACIAWSSLTETGVAFCAPPARVRAPPWTVSSVGAVEDARDDAAPAGLEAPRFVPASASFAAAARPGPVRAMFPPAPAAGIPAEARATWFAPALDAAADFAAVWFEPANEMATEAESPTTAVSAVEAMSKRFDMMKIVWRKNEQASLGAIARASC